MAGNSERYQIIWLIRRLFRALARKSDEYLAGLGLSAADRAVMEFLYPDKAMSVPEIAERYQVSRQHIQVTANVLLDHGLIATRANPRHRRSPLLTLNAKGRQLFGDILRKDEETLERLFAGVSRSRVQATRQTLQALLNKLQ